MLLVIHNSILKCPFRLLPFLTFWSANFHWYLTLIVYYVPHGPLNIMFKVLNFWDLFL